MKISEYKIVGEESIRSLNAKVNELIADGYQPYKALVVKQSLGAYQVMVKYDESTVPTNRIKLRELNK